MAISEKQEIKRSRKTMYDRAILTLKREVDRIYDKQKASRRENVAFIRRLNNEETTREEEQKLLRQIIDANQVPIATEERRYLIEISKAFMKTPNNKLDFDIGRRHPAADISSMPSDEMSDEELEKWQEHRGKPKMIG